MIHWLDAEGVKPDSSLGDSQVSGLKEMLVYNLKL